MKLKSKGKQSAYQVQTVQLEIEDSKDLKDLKAVKASSDSKIGIILLCMLSGFWPIGIEAATDVILPQVAKTMQLSASAYSGVLLAGTIVAALCYLLIGNLSDRFGRKRLLFVGIILTMSSMLLSGFAPNSQILILGSALLSVGSAILYVNALALGCSCFETKVAGKIIGLISAAIYGGRMAGPIFAGFICEHLGWRWVFWLAALIGGILLLLLTKIAEKTPKIRKIKFDWQGVCLFSFGILGLIYGFSMAGTNMYNLIFAGAGLVFFVIFYFWEKVAANPILPITLFKHNRKLSLTLVTIVLAYMATYGVAMLGSLYLQYAVQLSPKYAGMMLAILPFMQMLFSPIAGRAVDATSPRLVATCGLVGTCFGLMLLLNVSPQTSLTIYIVALCILGVSLAFISTPNTQAVMTSIPQNYLSLGSGLVGEFRNIGEAFSIGIVNIILVMQIGYSYVSTEMIGELTDTFHIVVILFLLISVVAAICSYCRGK